MKTLKESNLETLYNTLLYVIKVSPVKTYKFINKLIYGITELHLVEARNFLFKDVFLVKDGIPYLRTLDKVINGDELPDFDIIKRFKKNITLNGSNELVITDEPDLDYISKYTREMIDSYVTNDLMINYYNSENVAPMFETDKTVLGPVDIIKMYADELVSDIECTYYLVKDQYSI